MSPKKRQAKSKRAFFQGKATVFGRVISRRARKPVAGAEVAVSIELIDRSKGWPPCAEKEMKATTDDKGRYEVTVAGLKDFDEDAFTVFFSVSAEATRFVPERLMPVSRRSQLPFAGKRLRVDVELKPAFALAGSVVDEKGKPIEGVEVIVYQSSSYGCFNPSLVGGWPKTDTDGRFLADGMPMGLPSEQRQVAGFFHPDFQRRFIQRIGDLPRDRNGVARVDDVVLRKGLRLSGTVRDAKGRPVADANVLVRAEEPYEGDPGCARPPAKWDLRTDANGRYDASGLPPMYYHVIVTHASQPPGTRMDVKLMTRSRSNVDVVLDKKAGVLAGTIFRADGKTPAGGYKLATDQYSSNVERVVAVNKRGQFRVAGFAPHLAVYFEGFSDMDSLAWFDPPNEKADIRLPAELTVTGRLVDARTGQPVAGKKELLLSARPSWGRGFRAASATRSGKFDVPNVWPGSYFVCADAGDYVTTCRPVKVTPGQCDLGDVPVHRGVTLQGKVLTSTGRPIRNAEVFIDNLQFYDGKAVRTNSAGRYVFKGLSDGSYRFRVRAAGWAPFYAQELELPIEGGRFVKDVRMTKGVSVSGRLLDDGEPVTRQIVILSSRRKRGLRQKRPWIADTNTDDSGEFVFPNVRPGEYAIRCGLVERNITVKRGKAMTCNFRWPGRFKLAASKTKGGHAL